MGKKNNEEEDDTEALIAADEIVQAMLDGTFVSDTAPINIAYEVETIIENFGVYKGADVAARYIEIDQNDPERVKGWKEVERIIRQRIPEAPQ